MPGRPRGSVSSSLPACARGRRSAGFTLIEVLIVLVIVLAIGGIVAVNLIPARDQAIRDTVRVQLQTIEDALEQFNVQIGRYPTEEEGLDVLWDKAKLTDEALQAKYPAGGFFAKGEKNLKDQWGDPYGYRVVEADELEGTVAGYEVWSNGPDGEEGTADDITPRDAASDEDGEGGVSDFAPPSGGGGG